jgi:uncharacterized protein (DUF58 family)
MSASPRPRPSAALRRRLLGPGKVLLVLGLVVAVAAVHTGNNRLYLVLAGVVALTLTELLLGAWNLRNLTATRRLPAELFAGRGARGELLLDNPRRLLPAAAVLLRERGHGATGRAAWLGPGRRLALPVSWRFQARGSTQLEGLELISRFPFGLVEHRRLLPRPAPVLVYPAVAGLPGSSAIRTVGSHQRDDDLQAPRGAGAGDFLDLREYQPGDPTRLIHWPTSARTGRPMLVVRGTDSDEEVLVELDRCGDPQGWERAISEACGQILHHVRLGRAVGLRVDRRSWPPRRSPGHHRGLLTTLATLPHSPDPELRP